MASISARGDDRRPVPSLAQHRHHAARLAHLDVARLVEGVVQEQVAGEQRDRHQPARAVAPDPPLDPGHEGVEARRRQLAADEVLAVAVRPEDVPGRDGGLDPGRGGNGHRPRSKPPTFAISAGNAKASPPSVRGALRPEPPCVSTQTWVIYCPRTSERSAADGSPRPCVGPAADGDRRSRVSDRETDPFRQQSARTSSNDRG